MESSEDFHAESVHKLDLLVLIISRVTLSSGPWIAQVQTPNNNQWSVSTYHSEQAYMGVSTGYVTIENLYGDSADTVYYDLKIEYDP